MLITGFLLLDKGPNEGVQEKVRESGKKCIVLILPKQKQTFNIYIIMMMETVCVLLETS